jgi:hypothetical protein
VYLSCACNKIALYIYISKLDAGAAGMKAYIHLQHQELFWLSMVRTTIACLKSCLGDFQHHCIIRYNFLSADIQFS